MVFMNEVVAAIAETQQKVVDTLVETKNQFLEEPADELVYPTKAMLPQKFEFQVPEDQEEGKPMLVTVQSPHGPLIVPVPEGKKAGENCSVWLGPSMQQVTVPEGAKPGDVVTFLSTNGQPVQVAVPEDKAPGDSFEVVPPALMVRVPEHAGTNGIVIFPGPTGQRMEARVPPGFAAGQYFPVQPIMGPQFAPVMQMDPGMKIFSDIKAVFARTKDTVADAVADILAEPVDEPQQPMRKIYQAHATAPLSLEFQVPENHEAGKPLCLQGPHGPLFVPVPAGVKPGEGTSVWLGPAESFEVTVPEDAKAGDSVKFLVGSRGETVEATVPEDKQVGETFNVFPSVMMVQVPHGARPSDHVAFVTPMGQQLQTQVPPGLVPAMYFAVACPGLCIVPVPTVQAPEAQPAAAEPCTEEPLAQSTTIEAQADITGDAMAEEEKEEEEPKEEKTEEKAEEEKVQEKVEENTTE